LLLGALQRLCFCSLLVIICIERNGNIPIAAVSEEPSSDAAPFVRRSLISAAGDARPAEPATESLSWRRSAAWRSCSSLALRSSRPLQRSCRPLTSTMSFDTVSPRMSSCGVAVRSCWLVSRFRVTERSPCYTHLAPVGRDGLLVLLGHSRSDVVTGWAGGLALWSNRSHLGGGSGGAVAEMRWEHRGHRVLSREVVSDVYCNATCVLGQVGRSPRGRQRWRRWWEVDVERREEVGSQKEEVRSRISVRSSPK